MVDQSLACNVCSPSRTALEDHCSGSVSTFSC